MSTVTEMPPTKQTTELGELATRIKKLHSAVVDAGRSVVQSGIAAGDALIQAKRQLPHGQWLPWLKDNCGVSERRAQDYMKLAANRHKIEAAMKSAAGADLSLKWALGLLTEGGATAENGVLGKYEKAQETLIKRLEALQPEDAEAAAQRTIADLNAAIGGIKKAA
jgi:hypothetical protein